MIKPSQHSPENFVALEPASWTEVGYYLTKASELYIQAREHEL